MRTFAGALVAFAILLAGGVAAEAVGWRLAPSAGRIYGAVLFACLAVGLLGPFALYVLPRAMEIGVRAAEARPHHGPRWVHAAARLWRRTIEATRPR